MLVVATPCAVILRSISAMKTSVATALMPLRVAARREVGTSSQLSKAIAPEETRMTTTMRLSKLTWWGVVGGSG